MTINELDRALTGLKTATERVGANLLAVERDENIQLLEAASLRGETDARRREARTAISYLFDGYRQLTSLLDRAERLRNTDARLSPEEFVELRALLEGPSIELSTDRVSLRDRGLLDASTRVVRCTVDELIAQMSAAFDVVNRLADEVGHAWTLLVQRAGELREELELAADDAAGLGDDWSDDINTARVQLDRLGERIVSDPLSIDPNEIDTLERGIVKIATEIGNARRLRAEFGERIVAAEGLLHHLSTSSRAVIALRDEVAAKLVSPSIPTVQAVDADLVTRLRTIVALTEAKRWHAATSALDAWSVDVQEALDELEAADDGARRALEHRSELRGRLEAYNAKAGQLGLGEDAELARIYDAAFSALHGGPTDLERADALVRRYQDAIARPRSERKALM
jgi:hypothetical protein